MTTIYLSSTYEDLKDHRGVVFDLLRKSGYDVIAMEDYVATDRRPVDECLRDVARIEPQEVDEDIVRSVVLYRLDELLPAMVDLPPAGQSPSFRMGSDENDPEADEDEKPPRTVTIRKPVSLGKYEVTFEQYDAFAVETGRKLTDDEGWGRSNRPVINVSWDDATAYAKWLSE